MRYGEQGRSIFVFLKSSIAEHMKKLQGMIIILLIVVASMWLPAPVCAQEIAISEPQKISTELVGYSILGRNKNGDVLIYKKYRFKDEIDIYDKQMTFRRRKEITMKNMDYETIEVYKSGDYLFHFYTFRENKTSYLVAQQYNTELDKKGEPMILDSTSQRLGENYSEFKVSKAKTTPYYLIYKYELSNGRIDKLFTRIMDESGRIVQVNDINLPDGGFSPVLVREAITDDGVPFFLFENDEFNCKKEQEGVQYIYVFPKPGNNVLYTEMTSDTYCLDEMNFGIDNLHQQIVSMSFLKEDNKDYMVGYQYAAIDIETGGFALNTNYVFTPEMLEEMAGLTKEKAITNLPVYQIGTIIPRVDGGALMVAEYYDKTVESYEFTNYDPYYGYRTSTRQVEFYEYDDILLFSIQPDGTPSWNNVIRKKQISREDRGVNSSYAVVNIKDKCVFIFNEDIEQNANVLEYEMTATGELDRKSLFNANQQEVQIRPTSAEQISYNEIIIPSIYKKSLAFVRIKF